MKAHHKQQLTGIIVILTTGILIPFIVGQTLTTESPTLYSGNLACSGDQITFVCETKGSSIIAWTSNEYIGQGGAQLQFAAAEVPSLANTLHGTGDTVATFTDNRVENRVQVLTSTLRVTASSVYPNPSVTCIHVDNDTRRTVSFSVIAQPNVPRNVIAVQLEHTTENCVITILWHGPDNLAEAPVSNYTIAVNGTEVSHDSVQSIIEVNATDELEGTFSSVVSVPYCGRYLVALQAVNICGRESGVVTFTLFEETCLITQDMVCRAESIVTDTTTHYKTEANTNKNNADIPQALALTIGVMAFSTMHLQRS